MDDGLSINKPWQTLDEASLSRVSGQLGVFELGSDAGDVIYVGAADARSTRGLKGVLEDRIGIAPFFRMEVTTMYSTRRQELLMQHFARHGQYPLLNDAIETRGLGGLSP